MTSDRERLIDESLHAVGRLRATVSVEDRVMAQVRARAAEARSPARISGRQRRLLAGAAVIAALAEAAIWLFAAAPLLPDRATMVQRMARPLGFAQDFGESTVTAAVLIAHMTTTLSRAVGHVASAMAPLAPSPVVLAAVFFSIVLALTFIAVRRDRRRPAPARGLR